MPTGAAEDPGLIAPTTFSPNLTPAAFRLPGDRMPVPPVTLAQLVAAGPQQAGTSTFISDSVAAYASAAIGTAAVGGGTNLCRVFSNGATWLIG